MVNVVKSFDYFEYELKVNHRGKEHCVYVLTLFSQGRMAKVLRDGIFVEVPYSDKLCSSVSSLIRSYLPLDVTSVVSYRSVEIDELRDVGFSFMVVPKASALVSSFVSLLIGQLI